LIYFLALYTVNTKEKFKNFIKIILLFAIGLIGFIAYGIITGQGLWTEFTPLSTEGARILAFTHAFYLSIAFVIAFSLLIAKRFNNSLFAIFIMWLWLAGIVGSMMRHLWLGLIIGLGALFLLSPRKEKISLSKIFFKNAIIIVIILLTGLLMINLLPGTDSSGSISGVLDSTRNRAVSLLYTNDDTSASWRMGLWRDAKNQWKTDPIFGIGFGKQLSFESSDWQSLEDVKNIHNSPLAILVQTGAIGFSVFALFILAVIISSYKYLKKNEELRPYYIGILCAIVLFLFSSLFQPYLETNVTSIFLWMLLGLLSTARFLCFSPSQGEIKRGLPTLTATSPSPSL
jgi:O-antigen ligase